MVSETVVITCLNIPNPDQNDTDQDGFGDACSPQSDMDGDGVSISQGDCNDQDPTISPNLDELCDEIDHDCDQYPDEGCSSDLRSSSCQLRLWAKLTWKHPC